MTTMVGGAIGLLILVIAIGFYFLVNFQKRSSHQSFLVLKESLESLQRNFVSYQTDFERLQEAKSTNLRTEISQEFQNNRKELQHGLTMASQNLENKVGKIEERMANQLGQMSLGVQTKLELNIKEGFRHFEKVQEHLKQAQQQLVNLNQVGSSINELNNLLRLPHLRGNFGEAILESLLSDLLPQDSYELQYRISPHSTERVDAVIKYPNSVLPIDSKFPREQILSLFETSDPEKLESARKNLIEVIRIQAKQIKDKYIHPEHGTSDMALLFVPSETLYFEILRSTKLCEELAKLKVFAVSPNTLSVTLHAIAISRNYYEMAKGVEKTITELKKAEQHFNSFENRFEDVGLALDKAQNAFQKASTHLSRYQSATTRLLGFEESPLTSELPGVETKVTETTS